MRINLNLLPESRKKKIKSRKILKLFVWQESMLIFAVIFLLGITLGTNEIVDIRVAAVDNQIAADPSRKDYVEINEYKQALDDARADMKIISKIQNNNINWISVFQEINKSVPDGVRISSLSNEEYRISMLGIADNREQLIEMKSNLEGSYCFGEISIPINDIVLKNDIDFKVDFKVDNKCLIKYEKK